MKTAFEPHHHAVVAGCFGVVFMAILKVLVYFGRNLGVLSMLKAIVNVLSL
jgi:hypothetical protein